MCRRVYARVCVCIRVKVCGRVSISVVCRRVYERVCVCVCVRLLVDGCALMSAKRRESRKGSLANPLCRLPAFNAKKFIEARMNVCERESGGVWEPEGRRERERESPPTLFTTNPIHD